MANKSGKGSKSCKKQMVEDEKLKMSENDNQCTGSFTNDGQKSSLNEGVISPESDFVASTIDQLLSACNDYGLYFYFRNTIKYITWHTQSVGITLSVE